MCPDDGTVLEHVTPTPSHAGQVLDGKYRLDTLLAEGGMGAVYRATHVMLGKTVAIKLIRSAIVASPEIVRRFQREARAATALNHPNIVSVYDLGQTPDGTLYIAMEYIDGPSLKTLIQAGRAIPPMRTIAILRQVASALATAHRHNIIHRDLKPHNIMLATGVDGSEQAKLVDFGIAKTFDESTQLTSMGSALGTPYYMSPEQIEGRTVDARSDLYALGIILYEMLVGEVPFADQSTPAVLVRQLKERPARPSLKNPAVPPALEAIALRCLEKDPEQRFQTADDFAAALNDAVTAMNDAAGMATMPMMRATPSAPVATDQADATLVSPAKAAAAAPPPSAPPLAVAPAAAAPGTRPTVAVPQMQPAVAAASSEAAPPRNSSMAPLIAAAAVLLLLAGGYLWWSGRQAPASTTASSSTPADAPKAVPAMAGQEPAATADAAKANAAASSAAAPTPASSAPTSAPTASAGTAKEPAATAAATKEALASKMPPSTAPAAAVKGATSAATNATRAATGSAPAARPGASAAREPAAQPTVAPAPTPMIPENAAVLFRCSGAPDVCSSLRSTVNEALEKAGFRTVTSVDRADIAVGAVAAPLQDKVSQQFGQTFLTRTYSIELSGEAPKLGDAVSMPPATSVSFDAAVGRERLEEKSRLVAGDIIDRIRAFVKKKHAS
jgi:serine/threonine-protein kinase